MDLTKEERSLSRDSMRERLLVSSVFVAVALLVFAYAPVRVEAMGMLVLAVAPVAGIARAIAVWQALRRRAEPAPARLSRPAAWAVCALAVFVMLFALLAIGDQIGRQNALRDREAWNAGCTAKQTEPCVDVLRGGEVIATGSVVVESDQALALYDPQTQSVRQLLKRDGALTLRPAVRSQP